MRVPNLRARRAATSKQPGTPGRLSRAVAPALVLTMGGGLAAAATWPAHPHSLAANQVVAPAPQATQPVTDLGSWDTNLSAGAPAGAMTLAATPVLLAHPAAATPALIAGLAADGIPNVALNAYRVAAARIDAALPGCGIDWSLIAAIGRVESDHGQFGGATLGADGTSTPKIIGPALNGKGFAFIHDTDQGRYDGDTVYDRAVGPMQFIPSTWVSYAVDGNGDSTASPFDINDTALAAAHYLCVAGGDLRSPAGQQRAVLAYNNSNAYLAEVLALARGYATGTQVDAPLVGSTSGGVPAPTGDYRAPAAPGPAPAAGPSSARQAARPATVAQRPASAQPAGRSSAPAAGGSAPAPAPAPRAPAAPVPAPAPASSPAAPPVTATTSPSPLPVPVPMPSLKPTTTTTPTCGLLQPLCLKVK